MASGGSISINIGTQCDPFDLNPYPGPNTTSPQHGTVTVDAGPGIVTYTNNGDGATSDSFVVADASAHPFTINVAIAGPSSPINVSPASLANPQVGTAYSQTLSASGGTSPYTFVLNSGSLPPGLTFGGSSISGTPNQAGSYTATFKVTDNASLTTNKSYSITVPNPSNNIAVSPPPNAAVNSPYSTTLSASGATAPFSFALYTGSTLPAGLSLAGNGTLSGTPTALGTTSFQVAVTDSSPNLHGTSPGPYFKVVTVSLTVVNVAPPVAGAVSATVAHGSSANPITLNLSGGAAASVAVATAASHGTATASGTTITYTPTASYSGPDSFTYTATNAGGTSAPATVTVTVNPATVALTPTTLPSATAGVAYTQTITASGGTSPYNFAITAGALPAGLTLSAVGSFSGAPTAVGTFNFTVSATDSSTGTGPFTGARAYSLTVAAPTITLTPTTVPSGTVATSYSRSITASGGNAPYTYTITSGSPPAGLTLSSAGILTGTPTAGGTFNFTVAATDSSTGTGAPFTGSRAYSLVIAAPTITIPSTTLPNATIAAAYSQTLSPATGGTSPYTYAVTAGALPAGLTLSSSGVLSGVPTAGGPFNFTVTATDSSTGTGPYTGSKAFALTVSAPTIAIAPTTLANATVAATYSQSVTASGGVGTYTYAVTAGALPTGLTLSSAGAIAGTPTAGGTFNFTITATDSSTGTGPFTGSRAYSVNVVGPTITIAPTTFAAATVATSYSESVTASGGTGTYTFTVSAGALPTGLTLSSTGAIAGTPTAGGTFNFTLTATDSSTGTGPFTGSRAYSISVAAPTIDIAPTTFAAATVAANYSQSATASGGTGTYTYTVSAGALPTGLTLSSTGAISGTPTAGGTFNFTLTATDSSTGTGPFTGSRTYSISVAAPTISVAPTTLPNATIAATYSQSITASGGTSPYGYAVTSGSPPAGISLASDGTLSGTPTGAGTFNFTVTATDSSTGLGPYTYTSAYSLTVEAPTISINPASTVSGTVGTSYSESITASGGTGPYSYVVTAGALPSGVTLSSAGAIAGTPTAGGIFNFTVTATDSSTGTGAPFTMSKAYSLTIAAPTIALAPAALPATSVATAYSETITASGGTSSYAYAITAGALPDGLTLSSTGTLAGTSTAAGTFTFSVTATDSSTGTGPYVGTKAYSLTVGAPTIAINPASIASGTVGTAYSETVTASGGTSSYSYAVTAGALPAGLALSSTGTLSGISTASGNFNFTVTATDSSTGTGPFTGTRAYTLNIAAPTISISPATIAAGTIGSAYSENITASDGTSPYTYAVTAGALPAGLTLSSAGAISGIPTAGGLFNFTITATDSSTGTGAPFTGSRAYTLTVAAPTISITPATLPAAALNNAYSQPITASGATGTYTYAISAGALPNGLTLSSSGTLAGTPIAFGNFNFTVTATDSSTGTGPFTGSRAYTLAVTSNPPVAGSVSATVAANSSANTVTLNITGGAATSVAVSTAATHGTATASGTTISYTPTPGYAGADSFAYTATNADGTSAAATVSITVSAPTVSITTASVAAGTVGTAYSQAIVASGGTSPYSYAVTTGALPAGLTLSSAGTIAGTPTAAGPFNFTITATDSSTGTGAPFTAAKAYTLTIGAPTIAITPATLPGATVATVYSQSVTASGGVGTYTYAVTAGALPTGLTLSSAGAIAGTPTAGGTFNFTITATDSSTGTGPFTGSRAYSVNVVGPTITIAPTTFAAATVATSYSESVTPSGGTGTYTYTVSAGALPTGLTLSSTGAISGTPTAGGTFNFTLTATDSSTGTGPFTGSRAYSISVAAPTISITPATLPTAALNNAYSQLITASGGTGTYTYAITSGAVPAGLTLSSSGTLAGTPTASGPFSFTVTATDSSTGTGPFTGSRAYTLAVTSNPPVAGSVSATVAANSSANTVTLNITGGAATSVAVSTAAAHGTATASGTTISYTPTPGYAGADSFAYTATNADGTSAAATVSITVSAPTVSITTASVAAGTVGTAYSQAIVASGGTSPYSYAVTTGALPAGLTLSSAGTIAGTPTVTGSFNITITATDSSTGTGAPFSAAKAYTLTIGAPTLSLDPATLSPSAVAAAYSQTLTASGGTGPYGYAVSAGALPAGLTLSSGGTIAGIPTAAGSFNVTVTATDHLSFTASRAYNITVAAPSLSITPATIPAATLHTGYSQIITASGGTSPYTYTITAGSLPTGVTLSSGGTLAGTPTAAGTFNVTVTARDSSTGTGAPFTASQSYSLVVDSHPPIAGNVSATVAANSSANAITLNITGGTATSVAIATGASHGTATASGTTIAYTPTAGYAGADSFTYTATNADGTSAAATVSITVSAPTVSITTASVAAGTVGTAYSQAIVASGGTSPYSYAVTTGALPAGITLSSAGTLAGTPTASGSFNFTVTATDSSTGTGAPFTGSHAYTLAISVQAPIAGNVAATVAANSSANPITLNITGGAAASVAVATGAAHGTATASGTAITYTPASGYSGLDSFTYTATNASGTSVPATVSITVTAPTLTFSPASGALPAGVVTTAYSQTITASGGTSPYSYGLTGTLPAGLALNHGTGAITGTPTTPGSYSFSITATDANGATASAAYTIAIAAPPTTFVFSPAGGALTQGMAGEAYSQQISATGGTGTKIYSLASGSLPSGLVLNISTGQLTGPLAAGTNGDYSFTIEVRDSNGATGSASYTLKVGARAVTVADMVVNVPEGSTPPDVYLNRGATGGPFTSAILASVAPTNAGTVTIIQGQLAQAGPTSGPIGWYMHFTPNPAYSGQVRVGFRLVSALGTSNIGIVTYNISYDAGKVAADIDNLVHDFVQSRQNMIANTIEVPGLLQRRQMEKATDPITARMMPSEEGMTLGFSTSLSQMRAAGGDPDAASAPFNVWIDGAFLAHSDKSKNDSTSKWGSFGMVSIGADYLISDKALIGLSLHYDRMTDPTDEDAELTGNGWLAGPYASLEISKGVFWNGSLRYGGSSNTIDTQFWDGSFDTTRWMADTSIEGEWNLDEQTTISPKMRAIYFSEKVDDYSVKNSSGDTIAIDGFNEDQFRVSLGAEIARSFVLEAGTKLTPKLGLTGGYSALDGSGAFGAVTAGVTMQTMNFWMLDTSLLFNIEGDGQKSVGAKVAASKKF